jgi:hypothetical protein
MMKVKVLASLSILFPAFFWLLFVWLSPISKGVGEVNREALGMLRLSLVLSSIVVAVALLGISVLAFKNRLPRGVSLVLFCIGGAFLYWALPLLMGFI